MAQQIQVESTQLTTIRIINEGEIHEPSGVFRSTTASVLIRYVDKYSNGIEDPYDETIQVEDLEPEQRTAILNLIRTFEDKGKTRLGLV